MSTARIEVGVVLHLSSSSFGNLIQRLAHIRDLTENALNASDPLRYNLGCIRELAQDAERELMEASRGSCYMPSDDVRKNIQADRPHFEYSPDGFKELNEELGLIAEFAAEGMDKKSVPVLTNGAILESVARIRRLLGDVMIVQEAGA